MPAKTNRLSGGQRKYTPIWTKIKLTGFCIVHCSREDTITIMNGVKKEKLQDKSKPEKKILICDPTDDGVHFKLVTDSSINNL